MILLMRIKSQKHEFQTARQSEIDFKMANKSKYGNFNFVVEYPIWVSIKRTLTGKLAVGGQNFIYCVQFQKRPKTLKIRAFSDITYIRRFLDVFLKLNTLNEILTICCQLTRQSFLDRHPCRVFYDEVEF